MKEIYSASTNLKFERPLVTVDLVIFCVKDEALSVLLLRRPDQSEDPFPGRWALPGGFVDITKDPSLRDCAFRKLREKVGVSSPYLEQLGSWGNASRDPRGWSATHAYFALIEIQNADAEHHQSLTDETGATASKWFEVGVAARKRLAFDHSEILATAISRVRSKVEYTSLPAFLLPEPFTLPQLQRTYEVVLERPMDKSAFRRRMLDAAFLEEVGAVDGSSGRTALGYKIRNRALPFMFPRTFRSTE
jgi:8-oxo-dGTP diphosphatase